MISSNIEQRSLLLTQQSQQSSESILCIGDSNTAITYFSNVPHLRWSYLVQQQLSIPVINIGKDGRSAADFLAGKQGTTKEELYIGESSWRDNNYRWAIICFGLNDVEYYNVIDFNTYTRELITGIKALGREPILMTNVWVDYPEHYSWNRNIEIDAYDDVKRNLATELDLHLIDVNARFRQEYQDNGIWDTRIRSGKIWDNSQDEGKTVESRWFNNIHYNITGNAIVADEIVKYFQAHIL
jgi:lysophospholipase L1-like esterase